MFYQQSFSQLSQSEYLTKNAARINFAKKSEIDGEKTEDEPAQQSKLSHFETILQKLKDAYTEVAVLHDVIAISKEKHYMVLDPVPKEPIEPKPMAVVYSRKKALGTAASILIAGAEKLRKGDSGQGEFQIELLRLRHNWRLKKVSDTIIGDLSFRSAGSKYGYIPGNFEVIKNDDKSIPSPLSVIIPAELQGIAKLKVVTQKDHEDLCTASVSLLNNDFSEFTNTNEMSWQKKLEFAQNVLFCKELFAQLAKEAVQLQAAIPHVVIGNQIRATLLPGIQLLITLCHTPSNQQGAEPEINKRGKDGHDHVLEHSLHQLLREVHYKNTHYPLPHSGHAYGAAKKRLLAGPLAFDRYELSEMTKNPTILEQIIAQAQHTFVRKRTQYVLDALAKDTKDPTISSNWNSLNSPTLSWVKVRINTAGYDSICRSAMTIHIKETTLKAVCRDGTVSHLSYEPQELRDLIVRQIAQHHINGLLSLAKCMSWQILSNSPHLGIGAVQPLGNTQSLVLQSPNGDKIIAVQVRCEPLTVIKVYVSHSPRDFYPNALVQGKFWENLNSNFREVRFYKFEILISNKKFLFKFQGQLRENGRKEFLKQA